MQSIHTMLESEKWSIIYLINSEETTIETKKRAVVRINTAIKMIDGCMERSKTYQSDFIDDTFYFFNLEYYKNEFQELLQYTI